jgi:hypothetical protein
LQLTIIVAWSFWKRKEKKRKEKADKLTKPYLFSPPQISYPQLLSWFFLFRVLIAKSMDWFVISFSLCPLLG